MNHPLRNLIRNKELMTSLANTYGTPTYVYDYLRLKHNLNALDKSLSQHFNKYHICYAVKSNSNPHLLKNMLIIQFKIYRILNLCHTVKVNKKMVTFINEKNE